MILNRIEDQLRGWFGPDAGICVSFNSEKSLYPGEQAFVNGAVPQRRSEFSTGRWCAREAMKAIGLAPSPIPVGLRRAPLWPEGVTGSISHVGAISAAVVGLSCWYTGIGIDLVEIASAIPTVAAAEAFLISPQEKDLPFTAAGIDPGVLRFSAKESVIKAVSREADRWIEFTEIQVQFTESRFEALVQDCASPVRGWWAVCEDFLLTAAIWHKVRCSDCGVIK